MSRQRLFATALCLPAPLTVLMAGPRAAPTAQIIAIAALVLAVFVAVGPEPLNRLVAGIAGSLGLMAWGWSHPSIVIAAGANQKPGETRLQLLGRNAKIFQDIVPNILKFAPDAILLVATNPVDVMTHLTARYAADYGIGPGQVIGSGTTLDTARFRALLGRHIGVDAQHVHAYVVGEHGDSEVLTWSLVSVGGIPLMEFCREREVVVDDAVKQSIDEQVRRAAYHIIEGKGATYYGIGSALARITDVILRDQRAILTVCAPTPDVAGVQDVTVALPHLLGGSGIIETFPLPLSLSDEESALLNRSAGIIRKIIDDLEAERG